MPTVPVYDVPTQELAASQLGQFQAPNPVGFKPLSGTPAIEGLRNPPQVQPLARFELGKDFSGAQAIESGKAVQNFGQAMIQVADRLQSFVDDARTKELDTQLSDKIRQIMYDPEKGYMATQGKTTLELRSDTLKALNEARTEIARGASNPVQQGMFTNVANRRFESVFNQLDAHALQQTKVYNMAESKARLEASIYDALANTSSVYQKDADGKPTGAFNTYKSTAIEEANNLADLSGFAANSSQRSNLVRDVTTKIHADVVQQMVNRNDYLGARSYLDQQIKTGEVNEKAQIELNRLLKEGYTREAGKVKGDAIYGDKGPTGTDFESGFEWILKVEGTSYVADDAGAGPTKYGINSRAFPNEDISGMTAARAKTLYRGIWNDIGADKLPVNIRMIAFDSAVNHGPGQTKKFLEQAQGDPQKLIDLRRDFYAQLVANDPKKFGQYEKGWENRLQKLESSLAGENTLGTMLAETNSIKDPQEREIARQRIKNNYTEDQSIKQADYLALLITAQDAAFARIGGWQDVSPAVWASVKPEDRAKLVQGAPRANDPDTVIMLDNNPQLWRKETLTQYRGLVTEETYRKYFALGNGPKAEQQILDATIDSEQFQRALLDAGLKKFIDPKADSDDKRKLILLRSEVEREINLQQEAKKRKLTMAEKNEIYAKALSPVKEQVTIDSWWRRSLNMTETEQEKRFFQVTNRERVVIPPTIRNTIIKDMERSGVMPTESRILDAYLLMKR